MDEKCATTVNVDCETVHGFGDEWNRFDQSSLTTEEHRALFENYFSGFPWHGLPTNAEGFDLGCGSGRWAKLVAPRVGRLHCIDPSSALEVARNNLVEYTNCKFHRATADTMPINDASMDFGYSLGVLHHVPDTQAGIKACVTKLKPGAPFLLYLYYAFDNRPFWFRHIWQLSNLVRRAVSRFPHGLRYLTSQVLALVVYLPLATLSWILDRCGVNVANVPLSAYRNRSFYTMRTDALDRFGTRLEKRFTREQIKAMMEQSGLEGVHFSNKEPFWCAIGYRRVDPK